MDDHQTNRQTRDEKTQIDTSADIPDFDTYVSWDRLQSRIQTSKRSNEGKIAGVWAITELKNQLGDKWIKQAARKESANSFLLSPHHAVAFVELLDLALQLYLLDKYKIEGRRAIRQDLKKDSGVNRQFHSRVLLEIAALSIQSGYKVTLEKRLLPHLSPTDAVIASPCGDVTIEGFVVFIDQNMQKDMQDTNELFNIINQICFSNEVTLDGKLLKIPSGEEASSWFGLLEETARLVKADGMARKIDHVLGNITVLSNTSESATFSSPTMTGKGSMRLDSKILQKAEQAIGSGASWIRVDVMNGLWQFSSLANMSLQEKGEIIAQEMRTILSNIKEIRGVVISTGLIMSQGSFQNEEFILSQEGFALRRTFHSFRVRETIIVPLGADCEHEVKQWRELYDKEPNWLDWALNEAGLPSSSAVLGYVK